MNLSPRRKAALLILALFFVLGSLAIYAGPLSAHSLEGRIAVAAEKAIYDVRAEGWVRMRNDGQTVILSGQAPSQAARDGVLAAVRQASWAGGVVAGGVTKVESEIRLAYEGEDVRLAADLANGRLSLTGFAPDAEAVERVTNRAERLFPGRAEVTIRIAPGSAEAGWDAAVRLMLVELARLDYGGGRVADGRIALTGLASNDQTLDAVRAAFDNPPAGYAAQALVRTDGGAFEADVADGRLCDLLIQAALGQGRVGFNPGRASLTDGSRGVLRRAGRVFETCETAPLTVAVRAEGEEADAEALALERAEAIISAMSEAGVARERFLAESAPAQAATAFQLILAGQARDAADPASQDGAADAQPGQGAEQTTETDNTDDTDDTDASDDAREG